MSILLRAQYTAFLLFHWVPTFGTVCIHYTLKTSKSSHSPYSIQTPTDLVSQSDLVLIYLLPLFYPFIVLPYGTKPHYKRIEPGWRTRRNFTTAVICFRSNKLVCEPLFERADTTYNEREILRSHWNPNLSSSAIPLCVKLILGVSPSWIRLNAPLILPHHFPSE